ncbi:DNA methylase N-4/N-6 domain-containing protein [uncultured Desulfatiglans sp.]|nr:DNA methylase N-4/N-6 domain-containing protein [uncultured Desulfatiglans sp.]
MAKKYDPKAGSLFKKEVPEMPEGYYSGDKPNPNLRAFVEQHIKERPYDPETDDYDVPAFDKPIESTKATAIYNMHTYWSKKPHDAIRQYVRHYTKSGDLVLDPFCGSGGTALAALMEGRKAIAIDRSPAATFITKNYCTPVDVDGLHKAFEELKRKVKPEIDWLYETRCDRCGGKATTAYTVYSQVFQCPRCLEKVPLFDCVEVEGTTAKGKSKKIRACPHCHKRDIVEEISTRADKFGAVPVLVSYLCESGCRPARDERSHNDSNKKKHEYFEKYDLGKIREIEAKDIPHWYPKNRMMNAPEDQKCWGVKWRAGTSNFRTIDELFTKRNLWALAAIRDGLEVSSKRDILLFAFTGICLGFSKMCQWIPGASYPFPMMRGTYYMPPISKEQLVPHYYENRINLIQRAAAQISFDSVSLFVSTQDICNLSNIPSAALDYIFTDPPYAEKVQYGELNFIWEAWLGLDTQWQDEEIIVNEVRGKTEDDWAYMMRQAMSECYRVLKPGRCISLCYHDTSEGTWSLVQDIMAEAGFIVEKSDAALYIDTGQKSYNQLVADKVNKRDLVINFRKPKPSEVKAIIAITGNEDKTTFTEKVCQIIRDYVGANPGTAKDRIYDEVVSRMVRSGQMEAHDFDELLRTVAEEVKTPVMKNLFEQKDPDIFGTHEVGRWYLKETELVIADAAENAREDAAAEKTGAFITKFLEKNPGDEGVHYSDIFEHYIYAVKDKPRRQLAEFLPDYFYKTEQGTWRLPGSEEEEKAKREARVKGLGRRVKRYITQLEQGALLPDHERPNDATLAEWIRHCKRAGLYEQGKLLYEKGGLNPDNLSEEAMVNVEEDYQVCARMLAREASQPQRRGRKKAEE